MADLNQSGVALVNPAPAITDLQDEVAEHETEIGALETGLASTSATATAAELAATAAASQQQPVMKIVGVDLNLAGDQVIVGTVQASKWVPEAVIITNASTSLAGSPLTASIRTGAEGAGTAIVAAVAVTGLTAAVKFSSQTVAAITDVLTATVLFFNVAVEHGAPATADIYVFGRVLEV